jgi:hypothetical protein
MTLEPTTTDPSDRGWESIKTIDGSVSFGASHVEHYLEVFSVDEEHWSWSMTHPRACGLTRGEGGVAVSRKQAESRAIGASEKCRAIERAERKRYGR